jgi:hypothetical protein
VVFGVLATTFCPSAIRNALSASGAVRVRRCYVKSVAYFDFHASGAATLLVFFVVGWNLEKIVEVIVDSKFYIFKT